MILHQNQRCWAKRASRRLPVVPLLVVALSLGACGDRAREDGDAVLTVSVQRAETWVRNFNPLSPVTAPRWPTVAGIHEPLMVYNSLRSTYVPWLATSTAWIDDDRTLRVDLRHGVHWSDGAPFTAADVAFTFDLLRRYPGTDQRGVWASLAAVREVDDHTVDFVFSRIHIPGFDDVVVQPIVPEHIWHSVDDPIDFANPDPVGTGPFTEVLVFRDDLYVLGRNPAYWQPGVPALKALRFPAMAEGDEVTMGLVYGGVDWAGDFIPAVKRVFVEKDPAHHHHWSPLTGGGIFLYANTLREPFDDVAVRKAMSQAIDRQFMVDVAMFRYTRPADATGLTDAYTTWRDSAAVRQGDWVEYDPQQARARLDAAGYGRRGGGVRQDSQGRPLRCELLCVAGWTDWERVAEIIADGLDAVGVSVEIQRLEFGMWYRRVSEGDFDLSIGWSLEGASPYHFYRGLMGGATVRPPGSAAASNWHRYRSVAADSVLDRFEHAADPAEQHLLGNQLQRIFVAEAPAIPLFPGPSWAAYSTYHVRGFPTPDDPYADPSPNKFARGEVLLVLTRLCPVTTAAGR